MAKLPISAFLSQRLSEYDPTFEVRPGTAFESMLFKPLTFIVQPLRDEADQIQTAQSIRRILLTGDPDSFDEESVDSLVSNLYVDRNPGSTSGGVARVYYNNPVDREWPTNGASFSGSNGALYSNPLPFSITAAKMGSQIEDGLFYYDIDVVSEGPGEFDLDKGGLVSLVSDSDVASVTNKAKIQGGLLKETNTQLLTRAKDSIGVRDLVVGKGFTGILFETFSASLAELQAVGYGDPEMMRDVLFNIHVLSKVDGYVKTPSIQQGTLDVVGILIDTTRQAHTSANVKMIGTSLVFVGNPNIDRTNGLIPIVKQVKVSTRASFTSTQDITGTIDLSLTPNIRLGVDGVFRDVHVAGATASATTRAEVVTLVNAAFSASVFSPSGVGIKFSSLTVGLTSQVVIAPPTVGTSASMALFGLSTSGTFVFQGDGPRVFNESFDYNLTDNLGMIQRALGASVLATQATGVTTASSAAFNDPTVGAFLAVAVNDIVTIETGLDAGDYRVLVKTDNNNLVLDTQLTVSGTVSYRVARTAIKNGERVYIDYYYNPLSIDVGPLVKLDDIGASRGVRPGRDEFTIKDVAFLRIVSIEIIDPLTGEAIGTTLEGRGGYGVGGYGAGSYGVGSGADYRLVVNSPTERFSAFEDSFIAIKPDFQGFSLRVTYDYVPEVLAYHNFVRSERERVLDGDYLMKHMIPCYVSGEITYSIDQTDSSIPTNDELTALVKKFISTRKAGTKLVFSSIEQFLTRVTDPFDRFGTKVNNFKLTAKVYNADGTLSVITGTDALEILLPSPFPKFTTRPLTPRISHWIADNIVLTRVT